MNNKNYDLINDDDLILFVQEKNFDCPIYIYYSEDAFEIIKVNRIKEKYPFPILENYLKDYKKFKVKIINTIVTLSKELDLSHNPDLKWFVSTKDLINTL